MFHEMYITIVDYLCEQRTLLFICFTKFYRFFLTEITNARQNRNIQLIGICSRYQSTHALCNLVSLLSPSVCLLLCFVIFFVTSFCTFYPFLIFYSSSTSIPCFSLLPSAWSTLFHSHASWHCDSNNRECCPQRPSSVCISFPDFSLLLQVSGCTDAVTIVSHQVAGTCDYDIYRISTAGVARYLRGF